MAHFQNQYGAVQQTPGYEDPNRQVDEYGKQVVETDAYGNPVHQTGTGGVYGTGTLTGMQGHGGAPVGLGGGSPSSSSSSEDDGQGGRRRKKKGLKEKIKEKLPGVGRRDERSQTSTTTTPGGYNITGEGQLHQQQQQQQQQEKKGMMEKIKEKLPGHHH